MFRIILKTTYLRSNYRENTFGFVSSLSHGYAGQD